MKAALAETQKLEMLDLSGCALRADEFANESGRAELWLQRGARGKMPWDLGFVGRRPPGTTADELEATCSGGYVWGWRGCFF